MNKPYRAIILVFVALSATSCVTMKNYRTTKSQMLASQIELSHCYAQIDSLHLICGKLSAEVLALDSVVVLQHTQINSLSTQNQHLKDQCAALTEQIKEKKNNVLQKSSTKTKR